MREVDEALARAYAQRDRPSRIAARSTRPHWPAPVPPKPLPRPRSSASLLPNRRSSCNGPPWCSLSNGNGATVLKRWRRCCSSARRQSVSGHPLHQLPSSRRAYDAGHDAGPGLARHPLSTLVVDADLTGPMLARHLGLTPEVGLDDVVEGGRALSDALIDARDDHLSILPMRAAVSRPRDFLASPAWTCSLARLRGNMT